MTTRSAAVRTASASRSGARRTRRSATPDIKNNTIDGYQKNGITISNAGSGGSVTGNTITGAGPTAVITAGNGIRISSGATSTVSGNTVSGNAYSPMTTTSTGILLFGPNGATTVSNNTLSANDVSVYAFGTGASTTVTGNTITGSTFDGITLDSVTGGSFTSNSTNGGDNGIGVYATSLAPVKSNTPPATRGSATTPARTQRQRVQERHGGSSGSIDCRDDSTGCLRPAPPTRGSRTRAQRPFCTTVSASRSTP